MDTHDTFDSWMQDVNSIIGERYGLSADDLPDCPYRDWYDDGYIARIAARKALAAAAQ